MPASPTSRTRNFRRSARRFADHVLPAARRRAGQRLGEAIVAHRGRGRADGGRRSGGVESRRRDGHLEAPTVLAAEPPLSVPPPTAGPRNLKPPRVATRPPPVAALTTVVVPPSRTSNGSAAKSIALPASWNVPRRRTLSVPGAVRFLSRVDPTASVHPARHPAGTSPGGTPESSAPCAGGRDGSLASARRRVQPRRRRPRGRGSLRDLAGRDLEQSVAVDVAGDRDRDHPAVRELRPAGRLSAEMVHTACDEAAAAPLHDLGRPSPSDVEHGRVSEEHGVLDDARIRRQMRVMIAVSTRGSGGRRAPDVPAPARR